MAPRDRPVHPLPMRFRPLRNPSGLWSCRIHRGPGLPSRRHPCQAYQNFVRSVAHRRRDHEAVRRLAVRHSVASRGSHHSCRSRVQRKVLPRTTRPRSRHREAFEVSVRLLPPPPRAALLAGPPAPCHLPPWTRYEVPVRWCRSGSAATAGPGSWQLRSPHWRSYPCATEPSPVGRRPRLGRVELRLGPAWVRYRGTATPETDPPSTFHRPVLVPGRHRARSSRPRVTLPRCRPSPWCSPAATPTSPTYPALVPLRLPDPWTSVAAADRVRPGAC
jgi:hypothetical protein